MNEPIIIREPMLNSEVAERAIEILERDGWRRHASGVDGGPSCVAGALYKAVYREHCMLGRLADVVLPALPVAWIRRPFTSPNGMGPIVQYNDQILTSKEEAIDLLTEAAKYWRDQGE